MHLRHYSSIDSSAFLGITRLGSSSNRFAHPRAPVRERQYLASYLVVMKQITMPVSILHPLKQREPIGEALNTPPQEQVSVVIPSACTEYPSKQGRHEITSALKNINAQNKITAILLPKPVFASYKAKLGNRFWSLTCETIQTPFPHATALHNQRNHR